MYYKTLSSGFSLPEIGLGTGGDQSKVVDENVWKKSIRDAMQIGYTHIDCAAMYAGGKAESILGKVIAEMDRSKLTISTKVSPTHLRYQDLLFSVKESLGRMKLEYVDLLYIHAPNASIPLSETMKAVDECVTRGFTKNIAVSNFNVELLEKAQSFTNNKIVANQIEFNLATREKSHCDGCDHMESKILPYCQQNDILVVAYRPVDRGSVLQSNELLDKLANKYNKTKAQVAMNWLISQANVVIIPRSDSKEHLIENFEVSGWYLDEEDIERLRSEYPQREVQPYRYY